MLVSNSDDNKEQFMSSNEKIGSVITLCNLLKFNINMKYLHISCLYYLCNFWSFFCSIGFIWYFIPHIKKLRSCSNKRFCVTRSGQKQWNIVVYHYQNKTPGYDHILQKDCQISNGENSYGKFNSSETVNRINKYFSNKIHFLRCNRMHGLDKFIIHNSHCISSSYHFLHIHIDHIVIEKQTKRMEWKKKEKHN